MAAILLYNQISSVNSPWGIAMATTAGVDEREARLRDSLLRGMDGDRQAYESFLGETAEILRPFFNRIFPRRAHSEQKVEDLVQEVLLAIHLKKHTYHREMALMPWIFAIGRYRMIDSIRNEIRKGGETLDFETAEASFSRDPRANEEEVLNTIEIDQLFEGLTENQRSVMRMAKLEHQPLEDIAKTLGLSLSNVKVTVHRTMKVLKKKLTGEK